MAICVPRGETFRSGSLSSCFKNGLILFSKFVGPIDTDVSRRTMISFTHLSGTRIKNIYDENYLEFCLFHDIFYATDHVSD